MNAAILIALLAADAGAPEWVTVTGDGFTARFPAAPRRTESPRTDVPKVTDWSASLPGIEYGISSLELPFDVEKKHGRAKALELGLAGGFDGAKAKLEKKSAVCLPGDTPGDCSAMDYAAIRPSGGRLEGRVVISGSRLFLITVSRDPAKSSADAIERFKAGFALKSR